MRSVNKVILIGNLTRDPVMRQSASGQAVTTFGIATNREWNTAGGERKTSTEFHDIVAWARLGEICHQYLKKSKLVYVEGYLKTRSWETPEGIKKFKTEIIVQDLIILEKRPKSEEDQINPARNDDMDMAEQLPGENSQEQGENDETHAMAGSNNYSDENIIEKDLGL